MGWFSNDITKNATTAENNQVATQGGGAASESFSVGARSQHNVVGGGNVVGPLKASGQGQINIQSSDPAVAIAGLTSMQGLATLAVTDANNNATNALLTLQSVSHELAQVSVGQSPGPVNPSSLPEQHAQPANPDKVVWVTIGGLAIVGLLLFFVTQAKYHVT